MKPTVYVTDHVHSKVVCKAFAQGCQGQMAPPNRLLDGPAVVYGILRGCDRIIRECEWVGRDFLHIDHGYFRRGHYEGYYRASWNAFQWLESEKKPPDRWETLKINLKPWRKQGRKVVVAPLSGAVARFLGADPRTWVDSVIGEIAKFTDREIAVKSKDEGSLSEALMDAHILVTHSSNAAVDAIISGVPVIVLGPSACEPVATDLPMIEQPNYPDREPWCADLSYRQFTLNEFRDGTAWRMLNEA